MVSLTPSRLGLLMGMKSEMDDPQRRELLTGRLITRVAKHKGVRSISVVRRAGMEDELIENGADHVMVDGEDLAARVHDYLGHGVHRALDAVAGRRPVVYLTAWPTSGRSPVMVC